MEMLYRLSYNGRSFRAFQPRPSNPPQAPTNPKPRRHCGQTKPCGQGGIRTPVDRSRQIYSLLRLTAPPPTHPYCVSFFFLDSASSPTEPEVGFEPTTCCLQNSCSNQLSYSGVPSRCLRSATGLSHSITAFSPFQADARVSGSLSSPNDTRDSI